MHEGNILALAQSLFMILLGVLIDDNWDIHYLPNNLFHSFPNDIIKDHFFFLLIMYLMILLGFPQDVVGFHVGSCIVGRLCRFCRSGREDQDCLRNVCGLVRWWMDDGIKPLDVYVYGLYPFFWSFKLMINDGY